MNVLEFGNTDIGEVLRVLPTMTHHDAGLADEVAFQAWSFHAQDRALSVQVYASGSLSSTKPVFVLYRAPFTDYYIEAVRTSRICV